MVTLSGETFTVHAREINASLSSCPFLLHGDNRQMSESGAQFNSHSTSVDFGLWFGLPTLWGCSAAELRCPLRAVSIPHCESNMEPNPRGIRPEGQQFFMTESSGPPCRDPGVCSPPHAPAPSFRCHLLPLPYPVPTASWTSLTLNLEPRVSLPCYPGSHQASAACESWTTP